MKSNKSLFYFWSPFFFYGIIFFIIFRILFLIISGSIEQFPMGNLFSILIHSLRFDFATIGYFVLPIWTMIVVSSIPIYNKKLISVIKVIINYYTLFIIAISTIIIIFDFGFYHEFYTRINFLAFEYLDFIDVTLNTIINQFPYNLFLAIIPIFIFFELCFFKKKLSKISLPLYSNISQWAGYSFLFLIVLIIIIRGGFQSKPLNFSHSNISQYRFVNQLVINPVWNLAYSYQSALKEKSSGRLASIPISIEESVQIVRDNIQEKNSTLIRDDYPLLRTTNSIYQKTDYNVVIILMESFAGHYVGVLGNKKNITPEIDKLSQEGLLFTRMFSTGSRTNRGMSGTLLSFPAIPRFESIFKDLSINQKFSSLANVLKQRNYSSNFIFSGDLKYDNMEGFLSTQGYDKFYGEEQYNEDAFSTSWGVSDEDLFKRSLQILSNEEEPFFSTILTISNHPPYLFPEDSPFDRVETPKNRNRLNAFKYSDWALGNFISEFKKLSLYDRTIIVILGDHGFISDDFDQNTSIELASYHIPCLVLAPGVKQTINKRIVSQVDIIPTILELLGGTFTHQSWGNSMLNNIEEETDFAIMVPSGINHLAGMVQNNTFFIYNFQDEPVWYSMGNFPYDYQLKKIINIEKNHLEMEKTMLGILKIASHTLNTYKCGLEFNK